MLALVRDGRRNPPLALQQVAEPQPGPGEALVEVRASSVNRGELALLGSRDDGWRPGQDVAGVVIEPAGDGGGPSAGSRVVALVEGAAWSQRLAVPLERLATIDDKVTLEQAATLGIVGLTALRSLRAVGPLLGRSVLVRGARGGLGHFVVQLAAVAGAEVTAQARTDAGADQLRALGAAHVTTGEEAPAMRFDVVVDVVGGASLEQSIEAVAAGGTILLVGAVNPEPARITLLDFIGHEGARILTFFSYAGDAARIGADLATLAALVSEGRLRPIIDRSTAWTDIEQLLDAMATGQVAGKAVLTVAQS
jgi:NADPH:quinone reductase-like Zn-dependent oxidoreductase